MGLEISKIFQRQNQKLDAKNGLKIDRLFKNRNSNRYELYFKLD
jgi:hypothetical protein